MRLDNLAKETDRNKSYLVRQAIENFLEEVEESKLDLLHTKLAEGEAQIKQGQGVDGNSFMKKLNS